MMKMCFMNEISIGGIERKIGQGSFRWNAGSCGLKPVEERPLISLTTSLRRRLRGGGDDAPVSEPIVFCPKV